jgi:nitrile hydratase accessory protein
MTVQADVGRLTGVAALPRANGELVFAEPWHARAFGLAVGLVRERGLEWQEFQRRLVEEIGAWEREHAPGDVYSYYEHWTAALERLVLETGLASRAELDEEIRHVLADDAHDHPHDH